MLTSSNPLASSRVRSFSTRGVGVHGENEPLAPLGIFARLGVLLPIALVFGMAAYALVGVSH